MHQAVSALGRCRCVEDCQAVAVVDQLLQRHRPRRRCGPADARRAGGGLGEYYGEHDTRAPVSLCAGDTHTAAKLVGITDVQRAGEEADPDVVQRWLDDGQAPNGTRGRASEPAVCTASI